MDILTREDLRNQLKRREIAPVYLLFGPETYLRDLAAKTVADLSFSEGDLREFNQSEISAANPDNIAAALAAAEQLPMMSARRVITVKDVRISASAQKDTIKEEHEAAISAYLNDPPASTVLIFVADEIDTRRRMSKLLIGSSVAVKFDKLMGGGLDAWVKGKIAEAGSEADDQTVRLLIDVVGDDLSRLGNEAAKLSAAALPDKLITADLIETLVPNSRELSNFDLTDHLLAGRRTRALEVLKKILDDGAEPVALLGLISYNFRRLLIAKEMMESGAPRREVAGILRLRYNDQEDFLAAARRTDRQKLVTVIKRLAETDFALKTSVGGGGPAGARMQMEVLVSGLAAM